MTTARDLVCGDPQVVRDTAGHLSDAGWSDLLHDVPPSLHPMLGHNLQAAGAAKSVPEQVRAMLARARDAALVSDLQRRSVLRQVLAALGANAIDIVVLKGAALANTVYPHSYLRPMTDLDLWLPDRQLDDAVEILLKSGLAIVKGALPDGTLTHAIDQRRLIDERSHVLVELHGAVHSLDCLSSSRIERLRAASVPLAAHGIEMQILSPADAVLHTCLHLARINRFANSQLSLLDLRLIVNRWGSRIDWAQLAIDARREHVAVYLSLALAVAAEVWGCHIPAEYQKTVGPIPHLPEMQALAREQLQEQQAQLPSALESAFRHPTRRARLAAIIGRVFSPRTVLTDVTVKLPGYARAWVRGELAGRELRRRAGLAERRGRIGALAQEAEAQINAESARAT